MTKIIFRPAVVSAAPQPPPTPQYDSEVSFKISARPPAMGNLGLMLMTPGNLPEFDSLDIYSKRANGSVIGIWCSCDTVPDSEGFGTNCTGYENAENGASLEVRFKYQGSVVHRATAIVTALYTENVICHTGEFELPSSGNITAYLERPTWPSRTAASFCGIDPDTGNAVEVFVIPANYVSTGNPTTVRILTDPSRFTRFVCRAKFSSSFVYQAEATITY